MTTKININGPDEGGIRLGALNHQQAFVLENRDQNHNEVFIVHYTDENCVSCIMFNNVGVGTRDMASTVIVTPVDININVDVSMPEPQ